MSNVVKVGVIGASGYAGGELLRLLGHHPHFDVNYIAAGANAGEFITSVHQHLTQYNGVKFSETSASAANSCDLVFLALPHGESSKFVSSLNPNLKIVDLGADFRLHNGASWKKYYGGDHAGTWIYGLPDLPGQSEKIASASHIANPGCYATAITLAIAPALSVIDSSDVTVVAASGTTGAGRSAKINLLGSEVMNSLTSYKFGGVHQHTPEIEEMLSGYGECEVKISFTPLLAPMPRGILATITARLKNSINLELIRTHYETFYAHTPFVTLLAQGELPKTSSVLGSNSEHIQVAIDEHTHRLVVSAAIDNLGKGAAGQAIHNANLLSGFAAETGLSVVGVGA